jgi:amino acid permease
MEIVNATTTFNSTITLGGSEDFDGAFLLLPFLLALILGYLFINLKDLIKYMDILFIGLALMFVMIGITMLASYGGDATLTAMLEDYKQVSIWALYSFIAGIFIYGLFVAFKMWEKPKGFKDG